MLEDELQYGRVTAVTIRTPVDQLKAQASAGAETLQLERALPFNEDGGTVHLTTGTASEEVGYVKADHVAHTLTLQGPLGSTWPVGTIVRELEVVDRLALVQLDDADGDALYARIAHALFPALKEGSRLPTEQEAVILEHDGAEWVITDVLGQQPKFDGHFITGTIDGAKVGDGLTPLTPAAAPVIERPAGGVNVVDMRGYQPPADHLAFRPEFATSSDGVSGWSAWTPMGQTGALAPHAGLDYALYYKYRYRTEDLEGKISGYSPESVPIRPRQTNDGQADIKLGSIDASMLSALLVIASLITTGTTGQRVEFDSQGIRLYDSNGAVVVSIPVAGTAFFKATVEALNLVVQGNASFHGQANALERASALELRKGISDPPQAPQLTSEWDTLVMGSAYTRPRRGLHYKAGPPARFLFAEDADTPTVVECDTTGGVTATHTFSDFVLSVTTCESNPYDEIAEYTRCLGAVYHGTTAVALVARRVTTVVERHQAEMVWCETVIVERWRLQGIFGGGLSVEVDLGGRTPAGIATDGTDFYVPCQPIGGQVPVRRYNSAGALLGETLANLSPTAVLAMTIANDGSGTKWWFVNQIGSAYEVEATLTNGSRTQAEADLDFGLPTTSSGVAWDGSIFWTLRSVETRFTKHHTWTWPDSESSVYWCRFTWIDDNSGGSVRPLQIGDFESKPSPVASITHKKRSKLRVSMPQPPGSVGDVSHYGVYVDRGAAEPTLDLQIDKAVAYGQSAVHDMLGFTASATAPPGVSSFPGAGVPARIQGAKWQIDADWGPAVLLGAFHKEKVATHTLVTPAHWADFPEWTVDVTKKRSDTRILVTWAFTGVPSGGGSDWDVAINVGGTQGAIHRLRNIDTAATARVQPWVGNGLVSGIAAGVVTVKLQVGLAAGADNFTTYTYDDYCNFEVWEVPGDPA